MCKSATAGTFIPETANAIELMSVVASTKAVCSKRQTGPGAVVKMPQGHAQCDRDPFGVPGSK